MQPSNIPSQVPSAAITSLTPSFFPSSQPSEQVLTFASQTCLVQGNCILSHANALSSNYNEPAYCLFTSEAAATLSGTVNLGAGDTLTVDGVAMTGAAVTVNVGSIVEFIADSGPGSAGTGFVLCLR